MRRFFHSTARLTPANPTVPAARALAVRASAIPVVGDVVVPLHAIAIPPHEKAGKTNSRADSKIGSPIFDAGKSGDVVERRVVGYKNCAE